MSSRPARLAAALSGMLLAALAACATAGPRLVDFSSRSAPAPDQITTAQGIHLVPNTGVRDTLLERAVRRRLAAALAEAGFQLEPEREADVYVVLDVRRDARPEASATGKPEWEALLTVLAVDGATYRRTNSLATLWRAEARTRGPESSVEHIADALVQPTMAFFGRTSDGAVRVEVATGG
ncbi:MAG TPA: hypothetical protein VFY16_07795 [Gemmatimonadaceae bacterium]|nr:hypothetical protein [Gemmatimonadaceae bacterium]